MSRRIQVAAPSADNYTELQSSALTWAELQDELSDRGISTEGLKGVVRGSRVTIEEPGAQLPTEAFTLLLFTKQMKSGVINYADALGDLQLKINEAFNEIIESLEEGDYGTPERTVVSPQPNRARTQVEIDREEILRSQQ